MPSSHQHDCSPEERLSHDFDSGLHDPELLTEIGQAESAELLQSWKQLGEHLRALPVRPIVDLSSRVLKDVQKSDSPTSTVHKHSQKAPANRGRSVALLATSCAVMVVAATIVAFQANTSPSATAVAFRSLSPKSWEVVVVTVSDEQANLVTEKLRDAVDERGLEIHSLNEGKSANRESLELMMASSESSVELLEALNADSHAFETEWNPKQIGDLNRDELLSRFSESMQTPTRSDEFFGEVFVVLPKTPTVEVQALSPTNTVRNSSSDIAHADSTSTKSADSIEAADADSIDTKVARLLDRKSDRPVLVIFRRKDANLHDIQGQLPGSVRMDDRV